MKECFYGLKLLLMKDFSATIFVVSCSQSTTPNLDLKRNILDTLFFNNSNDGPF